MRRIMMMARRNALAKHRPDSKRGAMPTATDVDEAVLALHGWSCRLPIGWELALLRGTWRSGHLLLVEGRAGRMSISWHRGSGRPDLGRTVAKLDHRVAQGRDLRLAGVESVDDGALARWVGPAGEVAAAATWDPVHRLVLVWRQLEPLPLATLSRALASRTVAGGDDPCRWTLHGVDVDLPPGWRLEGLHHVIGLVRATWFLYPGGGIKAAGVCTVRRYALASRLLGQGDPEAWLLRHLGPRDQLEEHDSEDGVARVTVTGPGPTWWDRLRGRRRQRCFQAWREDPGDRLVVQEWVGTGSPLPCLRTRRRPEDRALSPAGGPSPAAEGPTA